MHTQSSPTLLADQVSFGLAADQLSADEPTGRHPQAGARDQNAQAQLHANGPDGHQLHIDLLAQRLAIHLSQEVWHRLFHGAGRQSIGFSNSSLTVLFVESLAVNGQRPGQENFLAALEQLARQHGGVVDAFAWGGSLVFYPRVESGLRTALALQRAAPEWKLRIGIDRSDCLVARFRSAGVAHATLLGPGAAEAAAVATASEYGSIGLSARAYAEWLSMQFTGALAGGDAAPEWRCERNGNGSMRLVPTNGPRPAA